MIVEALCACAAHPYPHQHSAREQFIQRMRWNRDTRGEPIVMWDCREVCAKCGEYVFPEDRVTLEGKHFCVTCFRGEPGKPLHRIRREHRAQLGVWLLYRAKCAVFRHPDPVYDAGDKAACTLLFDLQHAVIDDELRLAGVKS